MSRDAKSFALVDPVWARPLGEKKAMDAAIAASRATAATECEESPLQRTRESAFRAIEPDVDGIWECGSLPGAAAASDEDEGRLRRTRRMFPSKAPLPSFLPASDAIPQEIHEKMLLQEKANAMRRAVRERYAPKRDDNGGCEPDF